jgi:ketosteroid isomerase-like protein
MNKQFVAWLITWLAATKKRDLETVLKLMTEDVIFMVPG